MRMSRIQLAALMLAILGAAARVTMGEPPMRRPFVKPDVQRSLIGYLAASARIVDKEGDVLQHYEVGLATTDATVALDEAFPAIMFRWTADGKRRLQLGVPVTGEIDLLVGSRVEGRTQNPPHGYAYKYVLRTLAGSKRSLLTFRAMTDARLDAVRSPLRKPPRGVDWSLCARMGYGFSEATEYGWEWSHYCPERSAGEVVWRGFEVQSRELPGLVNAEAQGDWPDEERQATDNVEGDFIPFRLNIPYGLITAGRWGETTMEPLDYRVARGKVLGPAVFPTDLPGRFAKVTETLTEMATLGWIAGGEPASRLTNAVRALSDAIAAGQSDTIALRRKEAESLVEAQLGRGEVLPEVRDFLVIHLSTLSDVQPGKQ